MQAHVGGVIKGLVKDNSKYALNELLASRAPDISRKLASISWNARVGIVLIDDARLRAYSPRAAVEWALRYETDAGVEETLGGTWFSQKSGIDKTPIYAESYVSRTAVVPRLEFAPEGGPWTRAPEASRVRMTANETRTMLKLKAAGWAAEDFTGAIADIEAKCLADDAVAASPWTVENGKAAIVKSLGAFRLEYEPADVLLQDVVVGQGADKGLFAARRTIAVAAKGSDNFDSDRELVFGEIVKDEFNVPKLRYARAIFDPLGSPRKPDPLPADFPMASCYSNYAV